LISVVEERVPPMPSAGNSSRVWKPTDLKAVEGNVAANAVKAAYAVNAVPSDFGGSRPKNREAKPIDNLESIT